MQITEIKEYNFDERELKQRYDQMNDKVMVTDKESCDIKFSEEDEKLACYIRPY